LTSNNIIVNNVNGKKSIFLHTKFVIILYTILFCTVTEENKHAGHKTTTQKYINKNYGGGISERKFPLDLKKSTGERRVLLLSLRTARSFTLGVIFSLTVFILLFTSLLSFRFFYAVSGFFLHHVSGWIH